MSTRNASITDLNLLYAGCLDADPYWSLKNCDYVIVQALRARGFNVKELHKELLQGKLFRKLNRNIFYNACVAQVTRRVSSEELSEKMIHISSQGYAHLIPDSFCPVSITCHDLSEHYFPQDLSTVQMRRWEKRMRHVRDADLIFSVSSHTKNDIVRLLGVPDERIIVNHNGVNGIFCPLENDEAKAFLRKRLGNGFLILAAGANIYRKNLETLLEAVAELRQRGLPAILVKVGESLESSHCKLVEKFGLKEFIRNLGYVSEEELNRLYNVCDVLAFPSLYEGFGLPVAEAQRCGLPCVISNTSSLPEVGWDAALYHDPLEVGQLTDQLQRVFEDFSLRESMRDKGLVNSKRFSWDLHIDRLLKGFCELSDKRVSGR